MVRYFTKVEKDEEQSPGPKKKVKQKIKEYKVNMKPRKFVPNKPKYNHKKQFQSSNKPTPQFKGRVPIPKEALEKHSRGEGLQLDKVQTLTHKKKLELKEKNIEFSNEQAARTETLLIEESG